MPKFNLRKLYKFIFVFVMFFSCLSVVNGAKWYYDTKKDVLSVQDSCNGTTGCVPLCIYSVYEDNKYGDEVALIGFFYSEKQETERDTDETIKHNWQIAYYTQKGSGIIHENVFYYANHSVIPRTNIFWEGKFEDWDDSIGYQQLNNNFICPKTMYVNRKNMGSLCFEGELGGFKCATIAASHRHEISYTQELRLTYSFADDRFRDVMDNVITKLEVHDDDAPDYLLLASIDSSFQYNNTNLTEENCKYFKENLEDAETYSTRIVTEENIRKYINTKVDPEIKYEAQVLGVRYPLAYSFDYLSKMLTKDANRNFRNIGGSEKNFSNIDKLFYTRLVNTMTKGVNACGSTYGINIDYQEENMYNTIQRKYEEIINNYADIDIDFSSQYDCGIFNDEIANMISTGYFIIELISVVVLIAFSILDYTKVIFNGDADQMKKSNGNLFKRIVIVIIIFLLPTLINITLRLFKIQGFNSEHPLCVEIKK